MKSTLIIVAFVALCISSISAYQTECTRAGCVQYDRNGNGIQCDYRGCGPVRSSTQGSRYARGNNYATTGTSKCGIYGCVTREDPYASHTPYGSASGPSAQGSRYPRGNDYATTGTSKCGLFGCVTREDPDVKHTAFGSSSGGGRCGPTGCATGAKNDCSWYNPFC